MFKITKGADKMSKTRFRQLDVKNRKLKKYNKGQLWVAMAVSALAISSPLFITNASASSNVSADTSATETVKGTDGAANGVSLRTTTAQKTADTTGDSSAAKARTIQTDTPAQQNQSATPDSESADSTNQQSTPVANDSATQSNSQATDPETTVSDQQARSNSQLSASHAEAGTEQVNVPVDYQFINTDGKTPVKLENAVTGETVQSSSMLTGNSGDVLFYDAPLIEAFYDDGTSDVYYPIYQNVGFNMFDQKAGHVIAQYNPEKSTSLLFIYTKLIPLTTRTVDEYGRDIQSPTQMGFSIGKVGSSAPDIPGYTLVDPTQSEQETDLKFGQSPVVTFVYKPNMMVGETENGTVNVIVNYVDQNGNPIQAPTNSTGNRGTDFSISAPAINGYQLADPSQAVTKGTYQGNQMVLTLTYKSNDDNSNPSGGSSTGTPTDNTTGTTTGPATSTDTDNTGNLGSTDSNELSESTQSDTTSEPKTSNTESTTSNNQSTGNSASQQADSSKGEKITPSRSQNSISSKETGSNQTSNLPQTSEANHSGLLALIGMSLLTALGVGSKRRKN